MQNSQTYDWLNVRDKNPEGIKNSSKVSGQSYSINGGSVIEIKTTEDMVQGSTIISSKRPRLNYKQSILCGTQFLPKKETQMKSQSMGSSFSCVWQILLFFCRNCLHFPNNVSGFLSLTNGHKKAFTTYEENVAIISCTNLVSNLKHRNQ